MSATNYALRVNAPVSTNTVSIGSASSTAGSGNLGGALRVWMKSNTDTRIRFGASTVGAATAGDIYLTSGVDYVLDVQKPITHFRAIRSTANGTLYWSQVA